MYFDRMTRTCCSVPKCHNKVGGHRFPTDRQRQRSWVRAIRRENANHTLWQPTGYSVVCHKHFVATDYEEFNERGTQLLSLQLSIGGRRWIALAGPIPLAPFPPYPTPIRLAFVNITFWARSFFTACRLGVLNFTSRYSSLIIFGS